MASQEAPLISQRRGDQDGDQDDEYRDEDGGDGVGVLRRVPEEPPGLFVWLLTASAGISGLLFGYDTGVISATLVSMGTSLSNRPLTSLDKSIITSSTALFALLVSPFSSVIADAFGRKRVILLADLLFIGGAIMQAISGTVASMAAGRSVVGAAIGAASFVVPLYIAELAPANHRGRLITMNVLFITLGQVVAYVIGWAFSQHTSREAGWRWMVGLGAVPAAAQCAIVAFMPETPRWLVRVGRPAEARTVVERVAGSSAKRGTLADAVLRNIEHELREEDAARRSRGGGRGRGRLRWLHGWDDLFAVRRNRRALAIACLLQGLQQLCGFNSLMYFSATIFTLLGFTVPTLTSLTVATTNFVFTIAALLLIDRIGRRRVLLYSIPFMILGLLFSAYGFSFISMSPGSDASSSASRTPSDRSAATVILVAIMLYVASYAIGLGNVPWMQSELFALNVRSLGSGLATATNWGANFVIGLTFLPLMDLLTPSWTFVLYATFCGGGLWLIWRFYPETAGLSLEEAASLLEDANWGVR